MKTSPPQVQEINTRAKLENRHVGTIETQGCHTRGHDNSCMNGRNDHGLPTPPSDWLESPNPENDHCSPLSADLLWKHKMSRWTLEQNYPLMLKRTDYRTLSCKAGRMEEQRKQHERETRPFFDVSFKAYWWSFCILFGVPANMNTQWEQATIPIFHKPAVPWNSTPIPKGNHKILKPKTSAPELWANQESKDKHQATFTQWSQN